MDNDHCEEKESERNVTADQAIISLFMQSINSTGTSDNIQWSNEILTLFSVRDKKKDLWGNKEY